MSNARKMMRGMLGALAAVLVVPAIALAQTTSHSEKTPMKNIVQVAVEAGSFNTLVAAVKAAGLAETLQGPGPFTVFAPTDAAFAKLPAGALEGLLADKAKLRAVLLYHVAPGRVMAADVLKMSSVKTVGGPSAKIMLHGGAPMIGDASIVKTDVAASNGVIHVIDTVLMPPAGPAPVRKDGH